jgi:hypothetical protein
MIDNSTNNFTLTATGDVKPRIFNPFGYTAQSATSYTPSIHGGSAYFDGTGDYLSIATNTAFNFSTGDFTVEAWVYPNSLSSDWFITSASGSGGFFVGFSSTSTIGFGWGRVGIAWDYRVAGSATVNTWQHVAVTRSGTSMRLFVNGIQQGTTQTISTAYDMSTTSTTIGSQGANYYLNGFISNFRIVKGTALYTSNFLPPQAPLTPVTNTSLLTNFTNAGIIDQTGKNNLETLGGAQLSTAVKKYGSGSISMTSSGDYLKGTQPSVVYDINGGNFTIEFWVNFTSLAADRALVSKYSNAAENQGGIGYVVQWVQSSSVLRLVLGVGGGSDALYTWPWSPSTSTWYHVAITRSGTSGRAFVNGIQIGTTLTLSISDVASPNAIQIGKTHTVAQYLLGYIDDLRITKGYARYTSNFTPPSALITK